MKIVYFDETFGHPWVTTLSNLFLMRRETQPILKHIFQIAEPGTKDSEWTNNLGHGNCIVISGDQGKDRPRLPQICQQKNITHIILSGSVHHATKFERARAVIMLWPKILDTFKAPAGSRYQIQKDSSTGYCMVLKNRNA